MTSDKARKRQVRARMAQTGEPYTEAARKVGTTAGALTPADLDTVPGAQLPVPVAVMVARHFMAARMHIGAALGLAHDNSAPGVGRYMDERATSPLDQARTQVTRWLGRLGGYAERTAVASGALTETPDPFATTGTGKDAYQQLYPSGHMWCTKPGHTLPQPGEDPERDTAEDAEKRTTRNLLSGPVPTTRLTEYSEGMNLVKARDVVPGTPAARIWEAYRTLYSYSGDWPHRAGDAPGDLAAALEGCYYVLEKATETAGAVLHEISRRVEGETLTGADIEPIDKAATQMSREQVWPLLRALAEARTALDGAQAALPKPHGKRVPGHVARKMDGRSAAQIREELGEEVFINRNISRVHAPDYTRADALVRILDWMHSTGAVTYNHAHHAAIDPALAEG